MKAIVCDKYGSPDVLRLEEVERPSPTGDQMLVKVMAASVNAGDWHLLRADPFLVRLAFGLFRPKVRILGLDVAGIVEAVGDSVSRFKPGDEVFGDISSNGFGGFAEYVCASESAFAFKPASLSFEEAAAVPAAGMTALQALRDKGKVRAGQRVLIHGASGGVGSFAVQLARSLGAEVTAVCSTRNVERVRELGATHVIDYTREDFARGDGRYDVILSANGTRSIFDFRRALRPGGTFVSTGGSTGQLFQALLLGPLLSRGGKVRMTNFLVSPNGADVAVLADLIERGEIRPVIDRRYPLEEVPDAIRYLEEGHAQGKVVITVAEGAGT
jgi:NADPH:quinone reductase-like Zn-dependent oxidoreductase